MDSCDAGKDIDLECSGPDEELDTFHLDPHQITRKLHVGSEHTGRSWGLRCHGLWGS